MQIRTPDYYVGVDPGLKGAVAVAGNIGRHVVTHDYPGSHLMLAELLNSMDELRSHCFVLVENQVPSSGNKSSFSIGGNFKEWLMGFSMLDIEPMVVQPKTWQSAVFDRPKNTITKAKCDTKELSMKVATDLFPSAELYGPRGGMKDGRADAICIALYARIVWRKVHEK